MSDQTKTVIPAEVQEMIESNFKVVRNSYTPGLTNDLNCSLAEAVCQNIVYKTIELTKQSVIKRPKAEVNASEQIQIPDELQEMIEEKCGIDFDAGGNKFATPDEDGFYTMRDVETIVRRAIEIERNSAEISVGDYRISYFPHVHADGATSPSTSIWVQRFSTGEGMAYDVEEIWKQF